MGAKIQIGSWDYEVNSVCLYRDPGTLVEIEAHRRRQRDGKSLWAVKRLSECLSRNGDWEYEPMPSYRDDEFIARCRFQTLDEAVSVWMNSQTFRSISQAERLIAPAASAAK